MIFIDNCYTFDVAKSLCLTWPQIRMQDADIKVGVYRQAAKRSVVSGGPLLRVPTAAIDGAYARQIGTRTWKKWSVEALKEIKKSNKVWSSKYLIDDLILLDAILEWK